MKIYKRFTLGITLVALTLAACMPPAMQITQNTRNTIQTSGSNVNSNIGPYDGPVSLKIDTGLISGQPGKVVDLNQILSPASNGFSIQSVPEGNIVFQETFTKEKGLLEEVREFNIQDTSKRYTLHVAKHANNGKKGQLTVNINGTNWIKDRDFSRKDAEAEKNTLLLNANNSLRVRLKGEKGLAVTVTLVKAGEAGTMLRRRGKLGKPGETQATHVRRNDTNIFNPNIPDSLGGLEPYEGDQISEDDSKPVIGYSHANGTEAKIIVGELSVLVKEPVEQNLQLLAERFPIEVLRTSDSFGDNFATLKVDLDEASLSLMLQDIQALNQREDYLSLTDASFSSVNTAKTIATAFALQANALDLIEGVDLADVLEKHQALPAIDFEEQSTAINKLDSAETWFSPPVPTKASDLWWLDATNTRQAWNYSLGKGAIVAVLDSDFGIIQENPDFEGRIIQRHKEPGYLKYGCPNYPASDCDYDDQLFTPNSKELINRPAHGLAVSNFIGASQNNEFGIVGVAPEAVIVPIAITGLASISRQLEILYKDINDGEISIDVVNISSGQSIN